MRLPPGDKGPERLTIYQRAVRYVAKMDAAVAGENGHDRCFAVACKLVIEFALSHDDAFRIMWDEYNPRCEPEWSEKEIWHKINSASKQKGERGRLAGEDVPPWESNGKPAGKTAPPKVSPTIGMLGELMAKLRRGEGDILYAAGDMFDRFECGPGKVTVLGAPPGAGKTAIAMQYVFGHLEADKNARVVIANAEMSFEVLMRRELTRRSGVPGKALRFATLTDLQMEAVEDAASSLVPLVERIEVLMPPYTQESLLALYGGGNGRLLVVDYLQKFAGGDDPRIGVNQVMNVLRVLALDGWGVLAMSSVTRVKKGETLSMSSFKESGEIEFNADACYLLRDNGPVEGNERIRNVLLDAVKNRHGEMHNMPLVFDMPQMTFRPVEIPKHDLGWNDNDDDERQF